MGEIMNGDARILLAKIEERLNNHKAYMKEEFKDVKKTFDNVRDNNIEIFKRLKEHTKSIATLETTDKWMLIIGSSLFGVIVTILIKHIMG